jgi:hypothetical protein
MDAFKLFFTTIAAEWRAGGKILSAVSGFWRFRFLVTVSTYGYTTYLWFVLHGVDAWVALVANVFAYEMSVRMLLTSGYAVQRADYQAAVARLRSRLEQETGDDDGQ